MKLVSLLFKEDPIHKQLKKLGLLTDDLTIQVIASVRDYFSKKKNEGDEQSFLKILIKQLQEKGSFIRKLKVITALVEISKVSKYDMSDIIIGKKLKTFTKATKHKHNEIEPKGKHIQEFIHEELLIPIYNYLLKLSNNEELYFTCRQGEIPNDQLFRRGTKIRFIWIFKLYNIINILIPILESLFKIHQINQTYRFFSECITFFFNDLVVMNNFVVHALEEASMDNYMLMPYFDMLQFYESLDEQIQVGKQVIHLFDKFKNFAKGLIKPLLVSSKPDEIEEIKLHALRVKLISSSLKNPKNNHKRLETEYQEQSEKIDKKRLETLPQIQNYQQDLSEV